MDNRFDWQSYLTTAYGSFPEAKRKPVIGLTGNYGELACKLNEGYYKSIWRAGGVPVIIPPIADTDVLINTLEHIDGLLLTGGADFNPLYAGEEPSPRLGGINAERDLPELLIAQLAYNRQIPMLGICRGIQTLAMALGGKVQQDISDVAQIRHSQDADFQELTHTVRLESGSMVAQAYGAERIAVNSFHHQCVTHPGEHLRITATAPDGVVEAVESTEHKSIIGVQWHPEWLGDDGQPLFRWLVERSEEFSRAKLLHSQILTIDTHVDTPMFFHQGIHFEQRDPRILVDLHKMTEGRQDAVFMVCYLPQPREGEEFCQRVKVMQDGHNIALEKRISPRQYADFVFSKIEAIAAENSPYLSLARTPDDLLQAKREGKKSIVLGIENGLALEGDISNIDHFAQRGIAYITLCHNGDNDICDSAKGNATHGGVSKLGEQVIRRMNSLGIMVDLSHAAESSFYDALEISSTPIVCSHSNSRSLCDHPRNLTDQQMRRLAQKGGVAHTTLYPGFLRTDSEATILDAVAHLEHAISVMGIDHVGIGTDFDGDGGVPGMACASEVINFTIQLLRRRYSPQDIEKIWGGNWLRVMREVQAASMGER
jgi:microsomal dipeptidase-like Zn-dependent dipeptidase/gamma-glutamyl-gamma-aminobutyrate hydrolase PuuD